MIGNLKKDVSENIDTIRWTVYGKINKIVKNSNAIKINYGYDAGGNRTTKIVSGSADTTTFYVRDAQGNVLAVYTKKGSDDLHWSEQDLYGSSRLGLWRWDTIVPTAPPVVDSDPIYDSILLGSRTYELTNHLGNVLSTISDKKIGNDSSGTVNYYIAEVLSQNDYYPFGMTMPARSYTSITDYRYGFNGKEQDKNISIGDLDFGARIYDGRVGRWLSLDPSQQKYPAESPYLYTGGNPIIFSDPDGKDRIITYYATDKNGHNILLGTVTYKGEYAYTSTGNLFNGRYYRNDIYQNAYIDLSKPQNSFIDVPKNLINKEVPYASYIGAKISKLGSNVADFFSSISVEGSSQGTGSGSFQPAGYVLTGNSNGTTLDIKDQAGTIYGSIDIGGLLSTAKVLRIDPKVLTEMFDKSAVENVKTFFEKLSAMNDLKDVGQDIIDEIKDQLENREKELDSQSETIELLPETKKAVDKCTVCGNETDSSHINGVVRKVNEQRKKEAESKKSDEEKNKNQ